MSQLKIDLKTSRYLSSEIDKAIADCANLSEDEALIIIRQRMDAAYKIAREMEAGLKQ